LQHTIVLVPDRSTLPGKLMPQAVVVIGGSAGAVEALGRIVPALPPDLPAAVLVVVHFPAHAVSTLPAILERAGPLRAVHATDGLEMQSGMIYVAPPNCHLLVDGEGVRTSHGPRENGHRPAIDPLFRSAARSYGSRVLSVVLSGNLDDGTAGQIAVRRMGGTTIVQDPADARCPAMPASAIENAGADHVARAEEIGALIARLVQELPEGHMSHVPDRMEIETGMAEFDPDAFVDDQRPGTPSGYSCPECHGALFEIEEGSLIRYRCRVGHAYGSETLLAEQNNSVEAALWSAFKALKERAALSRKLADRMVGRGTQRSATSFLEQAREADRMAENIAELLRSGAYRAQEHEHERHASPPAAD
jgi:two-component system, chemotaxis family, protein-glutamate methylesterase/glutaminase